MFLLIISGDRCLMNNVCDCCCIVVGIQHTWFSSLMTSGICFVFHTPIHGFIVQGNTVKKTRMDVGVVAFQRNSVHLFQSNSITAAHTASSIDF